jgi:hypothetical protein
MHLDGWFSDVLKFKVFEGKKVLDTIAHDPTRLVTGADPASTRVWNAALGTHNQALVDQWGGTTKETAQAAKAAGINIGPGMTMEAIAHVVASWYAGAGLAKAIPQGDALLKVAEKLKTAADSQGGIGPQYAAAGYLPPGDAATAIQPWAPGLPGPVFDPGGPPGSLPAWVVPAGIGAAALVVLSLLRR